MTMERGGGQILGKRAKSDVRHDAGEALASVGGRAAKQQATRRLIARAASQLLTEHALGSVTMDDVAQAANVSKATLYKHYASKEALFEAVVEEFCLRTQTLPVLPPLQDVEPQTCLYRTAEAFAAIMLSQEAISLTRRCIEVDQTGPSRAGTLLWRAFYERLHGKALEHLHYLQLRGIIRSGSIDDLARSFLAMITSPLLLSSMLERRTAPDGADVLAAALSAARMVLFDAHPQSTIENAPTAFAPSDGVLQRGAEGKMSPDSAVD